MFSLTVKVTDSPCVILSLDRSLIKRLGIPIGVIMSFMVNELVDSETLKLLDSPRLIGVLGSVLRSANE